jgi:tRNA-splicing ligase RtcB
VQLWLMVHSGSRALGPAIRDHHLARGEAVGKGLVALAAAGVGSAYLHDVQVALDYAESQPARHRRGRGARLAGSARGRGRLDGLVLRWCTTSCVASHDGGRCGCIVKVRQSPAMGEARHRARVDGHPFVPRRRPRLCGGAVLEFARRWSSAGARRGGPHASRCAISSAICAACSSSVQLARAKLRDEAPGAYKDIGAVMRAQRELVRIVRTLRPVLAYKGA